ncbi:hypothetical protein GCM10027614_82270 [Micromonospora vulcania]
MTDFGAALDAGMGLVLDLPDRDPVDLLTVVGVRATEPPDAGLADLLRAHRYGLGDGLDLVAHGAPTNNDEQARSAYVGHRSPTRSRRQRARSPATAGTPTGSRPHSAYRSPRSTTSPVPPSAGPRSKSTWPPCSGPVPGATT